MENCVGINEKSQGFGAKLRSSAWLIDLELFACLEGFALLETCSLDLNTAI